jgi:hypothetical protein
MGCLEKGISVECVAFATEQKLAIDAKAALILCGLRRTIVIKPSI